MTDNCNTTHTSSSNEDAERMRLAFEQFMLNGGKNNSKASEGKNNDEASLLAATTPQSTSNKSKKKKKKKRPSTASVGAASSKVGVPLLGTKQSLLPSSLSPQSSEAALPPPHQQQQQQQQSTSNYFSKNNKKRYYQILRSFNNKIKHTWMDIDEQILLVLQNIVSIRGRLPSEWKLLSHATRRRRLLSTTENVRWKNYDDIAKEDEEDWKSYGYHEKFKETSQYFSYLQIEDIQLALSHDLEQHEKMLAGLRSLMSNLAECHDALGRIVDTLWHFHLECCSVTKDEEEGCNSENWGKDDMENIVNCVTSSYQMLSVELYRKQIIITTVIDSTNDDILGIDNVGVGKVNSVVGTNSQYCEIWKRSPSDEDLLMNVMKLGES